MQLAPGIKELVWGSYSAQVGDLAAAARHYTAASEQWPDNPSVWRVLAATHMALGRPADALATVDRARAALPNDPSLAAVYAQAALLRDAAADPAVRPVVLAFISSPLQGAAPLELLRAVAEERGSGDMERRASRLRKLVEAHPGYLPARLQLVQVYANMGRATDALASAKRAAADFPTGAAPAQVTLQLALAHGRWQDAQEAAAAWKQRSPVDASPADVGAARAQLGLGRPAQAISQLEPHLAAAKADPERQPELLTVYATALARAGRADQADQLLWPLAAKSAGWRVRWLTVALELPDAAPAAQWVDRLAAIVPPDAAEEGVALAEAYDRLGERAKDEALRGKAAGIFRNIAEKPNVTAVALQAAGAHAERTGDASAAEAYYRRAITLDGALVVAHNNLANLVARRGGDFAEATKFANTALKLRPGLATVYDTMAFVRSKAGDAAGAAANMRIATGLEPDNAKWRVRLAQYLLDSGETGEAAKAVAAIDDRRLDVHALPPQVRQQLESVRRQLRPARSMSGDVRSTAASVGPVFGG
jgi:tetratricopeptide (TPR) repeat protein